MGKGVNRGWISGTYRVTGPSSMYRRIYPPFELSKTGWAALWQGEHPVLGSVPAPWKTMARVFPKGSPHWVEPGWWPQGPSHSKLPRVSWYQGSSPSHKIKVCKKTPSDYRVIEAAFWPASPTHQLRCFLNRVIAATVKRLDFQEKAKKKREQWDGKSSLQTALLGLRFN